MQRLPLFPLGTVLVPGLVLPLRVFEPRYRRLVDDLLSLPEDRRVFGVVSIRSGHEVGPENLKALYDVGCTAVVRDVTPLDDGTLQVVATGGVRFRLHGMDDTAGTPYLTGLVSPLGEPDGDDADVEMLAAKVAAQFAAYRQERGSSEISRPDSPRMLSYLVAAGMALEIADRQQLLEQPDAARRLAAELSLLARERVLFRELRALPSSGLPPASAEN
ncbi:MAG: LON peptidase substrate-binding domain-containing protein [Actinomycetes bacterium]